MKKRKANVIDFVILGIAIILLCLAVYKFGVVNKKESVGISEEQRQITYTAFLDDVRMATVNALHKGDKVFDDKTGVEIGTITDVSHAPKMKNVPGNDGNMILVEFPEYYTVTLTLQGDVVEKEDGYFANGKVELKGNSDMQVYTKYAKPKIKIQRIDI